MRPRSEPRHTEYLRVSNARRSRFSLTRMARPTGTGDLRVAYGPTGTAVRVGCAPGGASPLTLSAMSFLHTNDSYFAWGAPLAALPH
jgi:hypothetical protein